MGAVATRIAIANVWVYVLLSVWGGPRFREGHHFRWDRLSILLVNAAFRNNTYTGFIPGCSTNPPGKLPFPGGVYLQQ